MRIFKLAPHNIKHSPSIAFDFGIRSYFDKKGGGFLPMCEGSKVIVMADGHLVATGKEKLPLSQFCNVTRNGDILPVLK